ncbi:MAG: T9SS type A sorting domain-containing protein [Chitinophagales bacterium]|nr:T9SS type A sorting domain-containing protein [Chitinophagales bacterium]
MKNQRPFCQTLRYSSLLLATLLTARMAFAQSAPPIEWQKSLGGTSYDYAQSIQQTADGGYIVAGHSPSHDGDVSGNHGSYDYWIVKLDGTGAIEWQQSLGGTDPDYAQSIQQTADGGYIVAGYSDSNDGDVSGHHGNSYAHDYWIVKLESTGAIEWQKSLGGTSSDEAQSIQQTADGGYIVAGSSQSNDGDVSGWHPGYDDYGYPLADYWIVKLDGTGVIEWQLSLGGSFDDRAQSVQQTADGSYIVAGHSQSNDGDVSGHHGNSSYDDYWIVKLDDAGTIEWQKSLGGTSSDEAQSIQQSADGGYIVAGSSKSNNADVSGWHEGYDYYGDPTSDYWIVKLDGTGAIEWQKSLGGTSYDEAQSIQQSADGSYIVAGNSFSYNGDVSGNHGEDDYWIVKLDGTGAIEWQKSLGGTEFDEVYSIQQTTDGGFIVAGYSWSNNADVSGNHGYYDYWIVKQYACDSVIAYYQDADGDGYGDASIVISAPACDAPAGYAAYSGDCNDADETVRPDQIESCNIADDNCNGLIDEGVADTLYPDNDGDGFGDAGSFITGCFPPPGYVANSGDCDDTDPSIHPSGAAVLWQLSLGGTFSDYARSIQQTADSGFIVAGYSFSNDGDVSGHHGDSYYYDCWIVKLDGTGAIEWQKSLGGTDYDVAQFIQQSTDGGYIVAGYSYSNDGDVSGNHGLADYWIVKLDGTGAIEWQQSLGGTDYDYAQSILQTADGGYIVAGWSNSNDGDVSGWHEGYEYGYPTSDYWIVKLDGAGAIEWQQTMGGTDYDCVQSILQSADGGYIVAGYSQSNDSDVSGNHGDNDYWIVKLDGTGAIEWQKSLGGMFDDRAQSVQQTADGGYIVAGHSQSNDGDVSGHHGNSSYDDYWIVKLDGAGAIEWQKSLGGIYSDVAQSIKLTADSGYIVAGTSYSNDGDVSGNHGYSDYWIVKLDGTGIIEWQKSLGGTDYDYAQSILQTADSGYIVAGDSYSNDGDVSGNHLNNDYWVIKLSALTATEIANNNIDDDCDGDVDEFGVGVSSINTNTNQLSVFPNPTDGKFVIELELRDAITGEATIEVINLLGQIMQSQKVAMVKGKLQQEIQFSKEEAEGMYLVKVTIGDKIFTAQIDLQK